MVNAENQPGGSLFKSAKKDAGKEVIWENALL